MRDFDIRRELEQDLSRLHGGDGLLVHELGLCSGSARVDMAIVNGCIHGFEIKSEADTLDRLPSQIEIYGKVLDFVTIVAGGSHISKIKEMVPAWWGIRAASSDGSTIALRDIRPPAENPAVDPFAVAQLLWRDEALAILSRGGSARGLRSKPRQALWGALAERLTLKELQQAVRETLMQRSDWRVDEQRIRCGA